MNTTQSFLPMAGNIFLVMFLFTWWFKGLVLIVVTAAAFIFHYIKLKAVKGEKADLERQLLERKELLLYASKNEQRANEKLVQEEKNKAALLSKINHEIRTPMNGVLGMTSMLKETDLSTEQEGYANTIINSAESLIKVINEIIINDILEYSKIDSGKELESKEIELANCIEEVLEMFAVKASKIGIDLLYYVEENVPKQIVGDMRRIRQILMNLVENAVRHTTTGEVFIGVQMVDCKEDNRIKLEFEVRDTGSGIKADKAAAISKSFSVTNPQQAEVAMGTGLIICKKLVKLMGGSISVKSNETAGTTFKFTIYSKAGKQPQRSPIHSDMGELENKKILIVDDNATANELLRRRLENQKMVTSAALSARDAMEILTQVSFDLVITDLDLTGTDGIQLAKDIRHRYPATPVVLLNNTSGEHHKHTELFSAELNKPLRPQLLLDAIFALLRNKDKSSSKKQQAAHKISADFSKEYPLSILIAEDNPVNQQWTQRILSKLGYSSEIANNGKEVLEVVSTNHYDMILMDVQMPEMDGLEATRMIRLCLSSQPVIMAMTANVMQGDMQDCFQSGMDDYISKPLELNEFVSKLEKWALLIKEKRQFSMQSRA